MRFDLDLHRQSLKSVQKQPFQNCRVLVKGTSDDRFHQKSFLSKVKTSENSGQITIHSLSYTKKHL